MKKRSVILVLLVTGLVVLTLSFAGCGKRPPKEEKFNFHSLTQQERKDYITDYLHQTYGLTCTIDQEVKQRQDGPFLSEKEYFAVASTEDNKSICIWVTKEGQITDTVFLLEMREALADYFTAAVQEILPDCKVDTYTELLQLPTDTLTDPADIRDYLTNQPTRSTVRIFVDEDTQITEPLMEKLKQEFSYCNISIYLYSCDNPDTVDMKAAAYGDDVLHDSVWKDD